MSFLLWFMACSQDHSHEEMTQRVAYLEQKVLSQEKKIQQLMSFEIQKKKSSPLCINEQPDVYILFKSKLEDFILQEDTRPRIYPHQKDGEIIGLRIANVPDDWKSCDLDDGDLLLSINDVRLRTPRTLQGLYQRKDTFTDLRVRRKRDEKEHTVRFRILNR
ncbi:MAG: hypothetical protein CL916_01680 [Deltaproteobacteria bacterium]|nr:hypothetical protein [Deltaproteobacteria bacterium]